MKIEDTLLIQAMRIVEIARFNRSAQTLHGLKKLKQYERFDRKNTCYRWNTGV